MKKIWCVILCVVLTLSLCSCSSSSSELSEENVKSTVETVDAALKEFDSKTLQKYVQSSTLDYIIKFSTSHEQFAKLGRAIFENLEMSVKEIDLDAKTVTVSVKNKDLYFVASDFTYELTSTYSTLQLLNKLNDDNFLDSSLSTLTKQIDEVVAFSDEADITLAIKQDKKNLVLVFDEEAENAVSGGALRAIKSIVDTK